MLTLGIDASTSVSSLALLRGEEVLAERAWNEDRKRDQQLFHNLPLLLETARVRLEDVALFAVGLGPGSFSGIRIALSAAMGMALPGGRPVDGVSSAAALADAALRACTATEAVALGDARRGHVWLGRYRRRGDELETVAEPGLLPLAELDDAVPAGALIVTADADRLREPLARITDRASAAAPLARTPAAATVARLTLRRRAAGFVPATPPQPIYLHPPVFVPPRFA